MPHVSTKKKAARPLLNPLDRTCVHPESYSLAEKYVWKYILFI